MAVGMPPKNSSEFEEGLSAVSQEDTERLQETEELENWHQLEAEQQADRHQSRLQMLKEGVKEGVKQEAKQVAKQAAKQAAKKIGKEVVKKGGAMAARYGIGSTLAATWEIWVPIALIIIGFILLLFIALASTVYACYSNDWVSWGVRKVSTVANFTSFGNIPNIEKVCKDYFGTDITQDVGVTQVPTEVPPAPGTDLVPIAPSGMPTTASDPRLRPCMLERVLIIYQRAQAQGINFLITSAYRPGSTVADTDRISAHSRGEAVDIAIVPADPWVVTASMTEEQRQQVAAMQRKIKTLVQISESEGFKPPQGDTLDEYNFYLKNGHIHIEFNIGPNNTSYCRDGL